MDRLERDPDRRGELYRGYDIFRACVSNGIVGDDSIDWLAQRMQELHGEGLIAHGPVIGGVSEPPVWDNQWLQSVHGWRVKAAGRADAALHRRESTPAVAGRNAPSGRDTDVFICHASEDKDEVARPLLEALDARGWSVWLDELELTVGDSISGHIEAALARSRFGVVVLSRAFFAKQWPQRELAGLAAREVDAGTKVILPVWHRVDRHYIVQRAPILADRIGALTSAGIEDVADKLSRALERAGVRAGAGQAPESVVQAVEPEDGGIRLTIPSTAEEQARVVREAKDWWEYLLFAGVLVSARDELENKWDDHELRLPRGPRREFDLASANDFLRREIGWIEKHIVLERILSPSVYVEAFGAPGQSGDPAKIEGMARRLLSMYESWLDWAAGLRNTSVPPVYEEVLETTACLIDGPVMSVREFIDHVADDTARLPELAADGTADHPVTLTFELKLDVEDAVVERNRRAWEKLRRELD
jgi:TIR domain